MCDWLREASLMILVIALAGPSSGGLKGAGTRVLRKCWQTTRSGEEYQCAVMNMLIYGQYPATMHRRTAMLAP